MLGIVCALVIFSAFTLSRNGSVAFRVQRDSWHTYTPTLTDNFVGNGGKGGCFVARASGSEYRNPTEEFAGVFLRPNRLPLFATATDTENETTRASREENAEAATGPKEAAQEDVKSSFLGSPAAGRVGDSPVLLDREELECTELDTTFRSLSRSQLLEMLKSLAQSYPDCLRAVGVDVNTLDSMSRERLHQLLERALEEQERLDAAEEASTADPHYERDVLDSFALDEDEDCGVEYLDLKAVREGMDKLSESDVADVLSSLAPVLAAWLVAVRDLDLNVTTMQPEQDLARLAQAVLTAHQARSSLLTRRGVLSGEDSAFLSTEDLRTQKEADAAESSLLTRATGMLSSWDRRELALHLLGVLQEEWMPALSSAVKSLLWKTPASEGESPQASDEQQGERELKNRVLSSVQTFILQCPEAVGSSAAPLPPADALSLSDMERRAKYREALAAVHSANLKVELSREYRPDLESQHKHSQLETESEGREGISDLSAETPLKQRAETEGGKGKQREEEPDRKRLSLSDRPSNSAQSSKSTSFQEKKPSQLSLSASRKTQRENGELSQPSELTLSHSPPTLATASSSKVEEPPVNTFAPSEDAGVKSVAQEDSQASSLPTSGDAQESRVLSTDPRFSPRVLSRCEVKFTSLGLSEELAAAAALVLRGKGESPTQTQSVSIPLILEAYAKTRRESSFFASRREGPFHVDSVLTLGASTGSGKTLAFLLPALEILKRQDEEALARMRNLSNDVSNSWSGESRALGLESEEEFFSEWTDSALAIPHGPRVLILCPSRALARQVGQVAVSIAKPLGFSTVTAVGGSGAGDQRRRLLQPVDVLVGTPDRILLLSKRSPGESPARQGESFAKSSCLAALSSQRRLRPCLDLRRVSILVLDEVDELWGKGFQEDTERLLLRAGMLPTCEILNSDCMQRRNKASPGLHVDRSLSKNSRRFQFDSNDALPDVARVAPRMVICCSATPGTNFEKDIRRKFKLPGDVFRSVGGVYGQHSKVQHEMMVVGANDRFGLLVRELQSNPKLVSASQVLVFCNTVASARACMYALSDAGLTATVYDGKQSARERTEELKKFQEGRVRCLVATDSAARGLHFDNLPAVVMADFPPSPVLYLHRAGRTGRCGTPGFVFSLVQSKDVAVSQAVKKMVAEGMAPLCKEGSPETDERSLTKRMKPESRSIRRSKVRRGGWKPPKPREWHEQRRQREESKKIHLQRKKHHGPRTPKRS